MAFDEGTCYVCGSSGEIFYFSLGGWYCYNCEHIAESKYLQNLEPLEKVLARQMELG
jgi:ribosomal protein L37AE/L43A